jgi:hypothetical protein
MEDKEKIDILLKEYDTLRAEILQRLSNRFAFLGLFGAVGAYGFFVSGNISISQKIVLFLTALFLLSVWMQLGIVVARCAKRVAEIEGYVNQIAGEKLLKWESEKLGSKAFHVFYK